MGSDYSGLFSGTRGSANSPYHRDARVMHSRVKEWAGKEVEKLQAKSSNKRRNFSTASIVYDNESGRYFYGRNKGIEINGDAKNPKLFGENGILPKHSLNRLAVGNCAEVDAINQALNAGAKLENLYISTIHATRENFGEPKSACENCTFAFMGRIEKNHTGWKF